MRDFQAGWCEQCLPILLLCLGQMKQSKKGWGKAKIYLLTFLFPQNICQCVQIVVSLTQFNRLFKMRYHIYDRTYTSLAFPSSATRKVLKFSDEQLMLSVEVVCVLKLLTDIRDFKKHCWKRVCQSFIRQIDESEPVFHNLSFRDSITSQAEAGASLYVCAK